MNAFLNAAANAAGDIAIVRKTYAQIEAEHQVALTALGRAEAATIEAARALMTLPSDSALKPGPKPSMDHARALTTLDTAVQGEMLVATIATCVEWTLEAMKELQEMLPDVEVVTLMPSDPHNNAKAEMLHAMLRAAKPGEVIWCSGHGPLMYVANGQTIQPTSAPAGATVH